MGNENSEESSGFPYSAGDIVQETKFDVYRDKIEELLGSINFVPAVAEWGQECSAEEETVMEADSDIST